MNGNEMYISLSEQEKILIVDDDPSMLQLLADILSDGGLLVRPASSGELALQLMASERPDLILMDVNMPGLDGFEVCRRIKAQDVYRKIPIIFVSAINAQADKVKGFALGAVDFVSKPFQQDELLARVRTHLELSREISVLKQRIQELEQAESERKRAEKARRESEEIFKSFLEHSPIYVFFKDANIRALQLSRNYEKLLGKPLPELLGKSMDDLFPSELAKTMIADDMRILKEGKYITVEEEFNGRSYSTIKFPIFIDGKPRYLAGYTTDITERKRAEEDLHRAKEFLDAVLDNLLDSLIVVDPANYTILAANKTFINSFGLDKDTVIGKSCYELTHNRTTSCSPPNDICPLVETLRTGAHTTVEHIHYDSMGNKLYVEVSTIPIISKEGEINQIIHLSRNITDRKRAETALQKTNLELLAIIDNLPFLAWLKDSAGRFMVVNEPFARSCCGLTPPNDLVGKTDLDIWPQALAETYRADDCEVMRTRQRKAVEELIADQGVQKWFETYKAPLFDVMGNVIGTTGFARDITERKQAEEQRREALEGLRKAVNTTIQVMVSAVEVRDPYTAGHQLRTADLARAIATGMGLPQEKIDAIRMAGSIHDLGKLSIPAEILSKPTKLTEIEFSLIKEHSRKGYEMLKDVDSPWPLAEIVYQHHERVDGSGYPRNLKGEEILLEARILNVADVVEAMSSHRPYRPGLGIDVALEEIEKNRRIFYDNAVVGACLRLFRENGFQLAEA